MPDGAFRPDRFFAQTIFTWGHRNVVRAVASGLAGSGSVDGYVYEVMRETEPDLIAQTHVVAMSELLGFPPVACATAVAEEPATKQLQAALLRMGGDEDGRAVLQMLRLDGFAVADASLFDSIAAEVSDRPGDRWMRAETPPVGDQGPGGRDCFHGDGCRLRLGARALPLASAQTHHLEDLAAVHLDGLAAALIDPVIREDTWEVFDILDRARQSHAGLKPTSTVVATADGEVLASSDPRAIPSRSPAAGRLF